MRFNMQFGRVGVLLVASVALAALTTAASAADLSIHLGAPVPPTSVCGGGVINGDLNSQGNPLFVCGVKAHGPITDPATPGTYHVKVTLDVNSSIGNFPPLCFAPASAATNETVLTFDPVPGDTMSSQLNLALQTFCFSFNDFSDVGGAVSGTFTILSGTNLYDGATGNGTYTGKWASPSLGGNASDVVLLTFDFTKLIVPPPTGCTPPDCNPNPGATPELDSLLLFGTGLIGGASYLLMRRRANRSPARD